MARILASCYFPGTQASMWERMAEVLRHSAAAHCPDWRVHVLDLPSPPPRAGQTADRLANTHKLWNWLECVSLCDDGDELALVDADMLVVQSLDAVWAKSFDIAYTVRPSTARFPLNAGVVFLRIGPAARAFMRQWAEVNQRMLDDRAYHAPWYQTFGGINQAALGAVLSLRESRQGLQELPCVEWNCEDSTWRLFGAQTRLVHIKAALRTACFHPSISQPALEPIARLWRTVDESVRVNSRATDRVGAPGASVAQAGATAANPARL